MIPRYILPIVLAMLLPLSAYGQKQVEGPRKVSPDSIEVTVKKVRLHVANVTFRCHYKASEFRSAINDLMN